MGDKVAVDFDRLDELRRAEETLRSVRGLCDDAPTGKIDTASLAAFIDAEVQA